MSNLRLLFDFELLFLCVSFSDSTEGRELKSGSVSGSSFDLTPIETKRLC